MTENKGLTRSPEIVQAAQRQSDQLLEEARLNPGSEAALLARILLRSAMLSLDPGEIELAESGTEIQQLESEISRKEEQLAQIARALQAKGGEQMNEQDVYNRIAEIVGFQRRSGEPPAN
jgi:hypothetical protein